VKILFYLPHLILITLAGLVCSMIGWKTADEWLLNKFWELNRRAKS